MDLEEILKYEATDILQNRSNKLLDIGDIKKISDNKYSGYNSSANRFYDIIVEEDKNRVIFTFSKQSGYGYTRIYTKRAKLSELYERYNMEE